MLKKSHAAKFCQIWHIKFNNLKINLFHAVNSAIMNSFLSKKHSSMKKCGSWVLFCQVCQNESTFIENMFWSLIYSISCSSANKVKFNNLKNVF